ncbi:three-prime repair exonuclease 1-like isoform X2 [Mercenaria mercenaria]|uniref:three-prime repair exonuclease 1-like isoform X2 n=1 Tax=Mercenaria mercenaria TaxID=6596 RepID=UPI00234F719A|nr:three-prime repair exonuclease 1-like isoform X2 [Mercenaria mercenaria]
MMRIHVAILNMLNRMSQRLPLYQITVAGIGHGDNVDVEQIPDSIPRGNFKPVQLPGPPAVISFDLETTGLIKDGVLPQITQIAAVELQSGEQFNTYVKPTVPISMAATTVTGISFYNEEMTVNGTKVQSVSIKTAMDEFVNWISKFKSVCLVAHNGRRFDFPILVSTLKNIGAQDKLSECAFIDSMSVFRKLYPNTSLKQVDLVSSLLGETYDAHNAMV